MTYDLPGDPECPLCHGTGVLAEPSKGEHKIEHPPSFRRCQCVLYKDITANVERGMPGLSKAPKIKQSQFMKYADSNLWVTASKRWFMANLRYTAIRHPPQWYFKVVSDADLVTAWLASAALKGKDILDPDAALVSLSHLTLVDLVAPPGLLIIRLGVKAARNVAAPEVLLEALNYRGHINKPTWVWDQPSYPLAEGHICYAPPVGDFLSDWPHLKPGRSSTPSKRTPTFSDMSLSNRPTLSGSRRGKN